MYLESFKIVNYRKFGTTNNVVYFVEPKRIAPVEGEASSVIGPSTTLILGKNNVGKTTIANALKLLCDNAQPKASDFNINYLRDIFKKYEAGNFTKNNLPALEFQLSIVVTADNNDLMSNLIELMPLTDESETSKRVSITVKVQISEELAFLESIEELSKVKELTFDTFCELIDQNSKHLLLEGNKKLFKVKFFHENGREASKFSLKDLINLREIKANRHLKEGVLTEVFNKIVKFQFDNDENEKKKLEDQIISINEGLTGSVRKKNVNVSEVLSKIEEDGHVNVDLQGNVTYDNIVKGLIKYSFSDSGEYIPEGQFGLGYINLLNIIGEIIHYVDSYQKDSHNSVINLLFIEEPEAFMHPQMQEFFINRIDSAVTKALEIANETSKEGEQKTLNCQIAVTTHSSHIVNSKIHSSNTFNNINYLTVENKNASIIKLNDSIVSDRNDEGKSLKFIKKHIKYKVSELFFSDAVIFVEGMTEEALLQHYLSRHEELRNYYISVFNITGPHALVYFPLAKALKIPCLTITDLDIKRAKCQRNINHHSKDENCNICNHVMNVKDSSDIKAQVGFAQIKSLENLKTTNQTICELNQVSRRIDKNESDYIDGITYMGLADNIYVVFQAEPIRGYYATSLEEAMILTNYDNDILNYALEQSMPNGYKNILRRNSSKGRVNLVDNSYEVQRKLAKSKSNFASEILYQCITNDDRNIPDLPKYISDGLDWLVNRLKSQVNSVSKV